MPSLIVSQQQSAVFILTLNRPDKKNAISRAMYQAMADALKAAATNPSIKVIVLNSSSDNFTSGNDIVDFLKDPNMQPDSPVYQFLQALVTCPLPIIAAVKGFAIGIGSTLLLHCEQVLAEQSAQFALPFINLGLVPEAGSSMLLPRQIGYQQAADLLLTGRSFSAEEAQRLGFISRVVKDANQAAVDYANLLAEKPRSGLIETKRLLRKDDEALQNRLQDELESFVRHLNADAAKEALTAFTEKRKADFTRF